MTIQKPTSWISLGNDALTLKPEPFQRLAAPPASLRTAVELVVIIGLIIGAVHALVGLPALVSPTTFNADEFIGQIDESHALSQMFG